MNYLPIAGRLDGERLLQLEAVSGDRLPSLKFSLGFITSCYVIFGLSMVQAMDIFMIT